jgi:16S rRNA (adenine1518-N6/adenine1519-N6)-dimethyltransferase
MTEFPESAVNESTLLGATEIRALAASLNATPTKKLGQNFVIDPNTVRRIVTQAHVSKTDVELKLVLALVR